MRRILILNLVLVAVLVAASVRFRNDWIMFEATHQPGAIQPERETLPKLASVSAPVPAPVDWTDIPSHNPFSFDRTDIAILEPKAVAAAAPPGARPILFGTIFLGPERLAMVAAGKPGNRDYRPMKVGEVIDGWKIVEIQDKSISIEVNGIKESIIMNDPSAQVSREYTRTAAPAAASTVNPGAIPGATQPVSAASTSAPPATPAPAPSKPGRRV